MLVYASRKKGLPAPAWVVFESLTDPHRAGTRQWLRLVAGEVEPRVAEVEPGERVEWSSLWRDRPDDRIVFELWDFRDETELRFSLEAPDDDPPSEEDGRRRRRRVSELIFRDLRHSYGN